MLDPTNLEMCLKNVQSVHYFQIINYNLTKKEKKSIQILDQSNI